MFRIDKEALTISGVIFGGLMIAMLVAIPLRLSAVWFRLLVVVPVALVLGYLLFPNRGKGKRMKGMGH